MVTQAGFDVGSDKLGDDKMRLRDFIFVFISACWLAVFSVSAQAITINQWQTANGAQVYFVASPQLSMVDIQVVFRAGSSRDEKLPGLAMMTNSLIGEGAVGLTADQIAEQFDSVGAEFSENITRDMASVGLRTLSDKQYFNTAFETFMQVISTADFPQKAFLRVQQQTLSTIKYQEQRPGMLAAKAFFKTLYGDTPYGHPKLGNQLSVKKMTRDELMEFYKRYYVASNAIIAIVGNVNKAEATNIAARISSKLPTGEAAKKLPFYRIDSTEKVDHIDFPSEQTHIYIGQLGIRRQNPDYFPLIIGNYVLGGGPLTSRLFQQIREKRGLAYDVMSMFVPMSKPGPFLIMLQTRKKKGTRSH